MCDLPGRFAPAALARVQLHQQCRAPRQRGYQRARAQLRHAQRMPLVLQAQRGADVQGDVVNAVGRGGYFQRAGVRSQRGLGVCPDLVCNASFVQPVHTLQFSGHPLARQALAERPLQGKHDQRKLPKRMANEHHAEFQPVPRSQHAGAGRGRLHHIGVGDLAEVLQRVLSLGRWRRFKNSRVGAGLQQRAARAGGLARHAGDVAQGGTKLATQKGAGVFGQGQGLLDYGGEAVAGEGEGEGLCGEHEFGFSWTATCGLSGRPSL